MSGSTAGVIIFISEVPTVSDVMTTLAVEGLVVRHGKAQLGEVEDHEGRIGSTCGHGNTGPEMERGKIGRFREVKNENYKDDPRKIRR